MSNARYGHSAKRSDPTRTAQAKRETLARRDARALKEYTPRAFDTARIANEMRVD